MKIFGNYFEFTNMLYAYWSTVKKPFLQILTSSRAFLIEKKHGANKSSFKFKKIQVIYY